MRDPRERLRDILEAIEKIERHAQKGRRAFEEGELLQVWFVRHLQVLGESARALPRDVRDLAPSVPWSKILGMRNILVHDYFDVDTKVVWDVVERDLPELKPEIAELLRKLESRR